MRAQAGQSSRIAKSQITQIEFKGAKFRNCTELFRDMFNFAGAGVRSEGEYLRNIERQQMLKLLNGGRESIHINSVHAASCFCTQYNMFIIVIVIVNVCVCVTLITFCYMVLPPLHTAQPASSESGW